MKSYKESVPYEALFLWDNACAYFVHVRRTYTLFRIVRKGGSVEERYDTHHLTT